MMESEDVRSPCAHAMVRQGHRLRDGAAGVVLAPFVSERPELEHTAAHAKALCAHCSHPHRRASRRGGRSLPVTARKPMGWVGSAASPPSRSTRTRCTQPEHPDCRLRLPAILFSSLPHDALLLLSSPCAAPAPRPSVLLLSSCCESRTVCLRRGPALQLLPVLAQPGGWWLQPPLPGRGDREEKL